ncbi:uncharacterized protein JCM6883_001487 [Sporobolomyces salmoneus]|uniref:uncharacterized protein n=1 Tax=Sporobolomyces salmoneus TaxID=183962 RepID=UPI00317E1DF1
MSATLSKTNYATHRHSLSIIPQLSAPPILSTRGQRALHRPPLLKCSLFENQFADSNPRGYINLGVAENSLCVEWLIDYFEKNFKLDYSDFTYGTSLSGSNRLFAALRNLFDQHFHALRPVERDQIITGTGASTVIDLLVSTIADESEGILVARPFYNGFQTSFEGRNGVKAVGVELKEGTEATPEALEAFEEELKRSEANGMKIRAIMICNPHNPLGFCYPRETLIAYASFCEKFNLHLIVDEIYALSTFKTSHEAVPFTSILSIDPLAEAHCNPSRIHLVYSASKDWGVNGLRLGVLVSQSNPDLHTAMESSCLLMKISSASDILWSSLLLDPIALPQYLEMNRSRLAKAYASAVEWLEKWDIPYRPSSAGHFVFIDLRRYLPERSSEDGRYLETGVEGEEELAKIFLRNGINVARGSAYSHPTPGFFRLTFTLRPDYFKIGLSRFEQALNLRSNSDAQVESSGVDLMESMKKVNLVEVIDSDDLDFKGFGHSEGRRVLIDSCV